MCGITRSYLALLHGDIDQAFYFHPLWWGVPIFIIVALFLIAKGKLRQKWVKPVVGTAIAIYIIVWLIRISIGIPEVASYYW